jgi:hypothetical protein
MSAKRCPECASTTGIRKIMYGMPMQEPDPDIYIVAGCIFPPEMPPLGCVDCGWQGSRSELRKASRAH